MPPPRAQRCQGAGRRYRGGHSSTSVAPAGNSPFSIRPSCAARIKRAVSSRSLATTGSKHGLAAKRSRSSANHSSAVEASTTRRSGRMSRGASPSSPTSSSGARSSAISRTLRRWMARSITPGGTTRPGFGPAPGCRTAFAPGFLRCLDRGIRRTLSLGFAARCAPVRLPRPASRAGAVGRVSAWRRPVPARACARCGGPQAGEQRGGVHRPGPDERAGNPLKVDRRAPGHTARCEADAAGIGQAVTAAVEPAVRLPGARERRVLRAGAAIDAPATPAATHAGTGAHALHRSLATHLQRESHGCESVHPHPWHCRIPSGRRSGSRGTTRL